MENDRNDYAGYFSILVSRLLKIFKIILIDYAWLNWKKKKIFQFY